MAGEKNQALLDAAAAASEAAIAAMDARDAAIRAAVNEGGWTVREVAAVIPISASRVHQIASVPAGTVRP
jgi:DNA-directed RNA polymerase specialized sigma subunit